MKIFLSSTCYDLADLRAEIEKFWTDKGHDLLLSERTKFPIKAGKHRHDVCIENVQLCDLMMVVLDSRYGTPYYKDNTISITWAEFRKALEAGKDIVAFIRKDIFNERQTCRHNQKRGNPFNPFFTDNIKTFDLIDEIQLHESGIWIQPFENSVEIKERLDNLYETKHSVINLEHEDIAPIETDKLPISEFSGSTASYLTKYIIKSETDIVNKEMIEEAIKSIPEKEGIWGEILGFEPIPKSNNYYYFIPIKHSGDEGEMIISISPTALGKAVRNELIGTNNKLSPSFIKTKDGRTEITGKCWKCGQYAVIDAQCKNCGAVTDQY